MTIVYSSYLADLLKFVQYTTVHLSTFLSGFLYENKVLVAGSGRYKCIHSGVGNANRSSAPSFLWQDKSWSDARMCYSQLNTDRLGMLFVLLKTCFYMRL